MFFLEGKKGGCKTLDIKNNVGVWVFFFCMCLQKTAEIDTAAGQRVQMCCWPPSRCCFQFGIVLLLQQPNGTLQRHSIARVKWQWCTLPSAVWSLCLRSLHGHSHRESLWFWFSPSSWWCFLFGVVISHTSKWPVLPHLWQGWLNRGIWFAVCTWV